MKRGRGRPKLKKSEFKGTLFAARFNEEETKALNAAIKEAKKTKSKWIRERLLRGVKV